MGVPNSQLGQDDVYVKYDYEDVMFRYDAANQKFFRKFISESKETEVPYDNRLLNDALRFGDCIDPGAYHGTENSEKGFDPDELDKEDEEEEGEEEPDGD